MGPIMVFGHLRPDNDSICSAVAYAHLKNVSDPDNIYIPARLGPMPSETTWLFERYGVSVPIEIAHVRTRVRDVMVADVVTVCADQTMLEVGRLMREHQVRVLPVLEGGFVRGLVTQARLAEMYLEEIEIRGFLTRHVTVGDLAGAIHGNLLLGDPDRELTGNVLIGAMEPTTMLGYIAPGDTLIVGDRKRTQPMALDAGVACLILTGGARPDDHVVELAEQNGAAIISTYHDTFATARLVNLSHSVRDHMETSVPFAEPDVLLSEVAEDILVSANRALVVVDSEGRLSGMVTRTNVARGLRRPVILVDHNEMSQSAPGIEEAAVLEIIDHHRVGDVQTSGPILFMNMPVGSTATIVALRYEHLGVKPTEQMAALMLSAVMTDTVLLKSPTATEVDRQVASRLADILGVHPMEFGIEVLKSRDSSMPFSAERAVTADLKEYRIGDSRIAISQMETADLPNVMSNAKDIRAAMERLREFQGYDLVLMMITDVIQEGSEVMAVGRIRLAERALGVSFSEGSVWIDGLLSRKKQIAERLLDAANS
ncbi:MAG: putative manganese-dependent inorganic diphosphatase [Actinobacteria bacterium]|nr:putative manganese-dependent inorganic diphosphatase [Actinomycetota bacterium]